MVLSTGAVVGRNLIACEAVEVRLIRLELEGSSRLLDDRAVVDRTLLDEIVLGSGVLIVEVVVEVSILTGGGLGSGSRTGSEVVDISSTLLVVGSGAGTGGGGGGRRWWWRW